MTVTRTYAIVGNDFVAAPAALRPWPKIKPYRFPSVSAFCLQAEAGGWFITAVGHAILATRIACHAIDHAVFVPIHFLQHLGVSLVMSCAIGAHRVGHKITWRFPAHQIPRRDGPG